MLRRHLRQRKEYIYRKTAEIQSKALSQKKEQIKNAIDTGKDLPVELREEAIDIAKKMEFDDEGGEGVINHLDDEYRNAGIEDPRVVVTTSSKPSRALKQFSKEICLLFPNCQKINRGANDIKSLVKSCASNNISDLVIVTETHGKPDGMIISHLPYGPTAFFTLHNVVTRHSIKDQAPGVPQSYPNLIFHNFKSKIGSRFLNILKFMYPVPRMDASRTVTFYNEDDLICLRHHSFKKNRNEVDLTELGPRMDLQPYKIILGTIDMVQTAETEWVYRPYMNTSYKKSILS